MEEMKLIVDAIANLGASGAEGFKWYIFCRVVESGLSVTGWLGFVFAVYKVAMFALTKSFENQNRNKGLENSEK